MAPPASPPSAYPRGSRSNALVEFLVFLASTAIRLVVTGFTLALSPLIFWLNRRAQGAPKQFKSILITGASQGLGAGMAEYWAAPGVTLHLCARNASNLKAVADTCTSLGAVVRVVPCDVLDAEATARAIEEADKAAPLDCVVANAGVSHGTLPQDWSLTQTARKIEEVNVIGVVNTIFPAFEFMKTRNHGQIAIMSSLASSGPIPMLGSYASSKAAARYLGEGFRPILADANVGLTVLCPGFIRSAMTQANLDKGMSMPFFMEQSKGVPMLCRAVEENAAVCAFPAPLAALAFGLSEIGYEMRTLVNRIMWPKGRAKVGHKAFARAVSSSRSAQT